MTATDPSSEGGVWIPTSRIYDELVEVHRKVDRLLEHDLPPRMRALEVRTLWGALPIVTTIAGIVAATQRIVT